jgi:hypothetical protein
MALDLASGTQPVSSDVRGEFSNRTFLLLLLLITLASAVPRLFLGAKQFISYDGYWHLFIARHNDWSMWWAEVKADGHPPLYYLIQYFVFQLGRSHLLYRAASILPGVGATFVIGLIAAKLFRHRAVALLTALSYGFAMTIIDLTIDVRAYPLAIFFCLLAYYVFLEIIRDPAATGHSRRLFCFALFVSLAILNEYYSLLFFVSCLAVPVFYSLRDSRYRALAVASLGRWRVAWSAAIGVPVLVTAVMYDLQMRFMPGPQLHLREFYWAPHSGITLSDFLFKNLANELGYFFPASVLTLAGLTLLLLLTLPVLVNRLMLRRDAATESLRGSPALILIFLLLELMFASATGHYPFGGLLRQQSIIAPFFTLTGFLFLDWTLDAARRSWQRLSLTVVVALCIAVTFVHSWRHYIVAPEELSSAQYRNFQSAFNPPVIYSDFYSTFLYFLHTRDSDWHYERFFRQLGRQILTYRVTNPAGQHLEFMRCRDDWNFNLSDPAFYANLASDLRTAGLDSVVLFYLKQDGHPLDAAVCRADEKKFRALAAGAGLEYGRSVYDGLQAYVEFHIRPFGPVPSISIGAGSLPEHVGDGWYLPDQRIRWMGERAVVRELGPVAGPSDLLVETFWPSTLLDDGPVHVFAEAGGMALKPIEVSGKDGIRDLRWRLPKALSGRKSIDVVLKVDKARQSDKDPRTLGMAVSRIALESPDSTR